MDLTQQDSPLGRDENQSPREIAAHVQPEALAAPMPSSASASGPPCPVEGSVSEKSDSMPNVPDVAPNMKSENSKAAVRSEPFSDQRKPSEVDNNISASLLRQVTYLFHMPFLHPCLK